MASAHERNFLGIIALGSLFSASVVSSCKQDSAGATPSAAASVTAAAASAAPPAAGPLKVAFAYVGPVGDAGWTYAHDQARKALVAEFGTKIATSFVENVPEGADAERVMRDLVSQGNQLIFGTTFGYMEPMLKVASDAKQVKFEHATGYKSSGNMRTYDSRTYEGAYMVGVIAGSMTKSNMLGVVASIPSPRSFATSTHSRWAREA
jgi:basic membrane protein A